MRTALLVGLGLLAHVLPLAGTTVLRYDLAELTQRSARVVVGRCRSTGAELVDGRIFTRVLIAVDETIKGEAADEVTLHLVGGQYQGVRTHVAGVPTFTPGEEVVVFLTENDGLGHAWPVGLAQGKFRVQHSGPAAKPYVVQDLDGLEFHHSDTGEARKTAAETATNGFPLDAFLARVRELARGDLGVADALR